VDLNYNLQVLERDCSNVAPKYTPHYTTQDDGDQPPAWSQGRKKLPSDLESELQTSPFETYSLMRGQATGSLFGSTLKCVGKLKGLITVVAKRSNSNSSNSGGGNTGAKKRKSIKNVYVDSDSEDEVELTPEEKEQKQRRDGFIKSLLNPEKYVVRLYCLTGKGLAAMDLNIFGQPANSDPYLKVCLLCAVCCICLDRCMYCV